MRVGLPCTYTRAVAALLAAPASSQDTDGAKQTERDEEAKVEFKRLENEPDAVTDDLGPCDGFRAVKTMLASNTKEKALREKSWPQLMLTSNVTTPALVNRGDKQATLVAEMYCASAFTAPASPKRHASPSS